MRSAKAHLRTVCCMGLPPEAAAIAIAPLLREVVKADWMRIGLNEPNGNPKMGFGEHPDWGPLFVKLFEDVILAPSSPLAGYHEIVRSETVGYSLDIQGPVYFETAYYREFERHLDSHWVLDGAIRTPGGDFAALLLSRRPRAAPFTEADKQTLTDVLPWIAHAFGPMQPAALDEPARGGADRFARTPLRRASILLDRELNVLHRTSGAESVLHMLDGTAHSWNAHSPARKALPDLVLAVAADLFRAAQDDATARPPRRRRVTPWGLVVAEATWLAPSGSAPSVLTGDPTEGRLVLVSLELREAAAPHAARALRELGASPAQVRIGTHLALGKSKPAIAAALSVKLSSVEDASRKLYDRLSVRSASELSALLWTE